MQTCGRQARALRYGAGALVSASPAATPALEHGSPQWLRQARTARRLSWLSVAYMAAEGAVAVTAAVLAGSVALLGFGLDSVIEAPASIIVVWRFTGTRTLSQAAERRAQQAVAVTHFLLAPPASPPTPSAPSSPGSTPPSPGPASPCPPPA